MNWVAAPFAIRKQIASNHEYDLGGTICFRPDTFKVRYTCSFRPELTGGVYGEMPYEWFHVTTQTHSFPLLCVS